MRSGALLIFAGIAHHTLWALLSLSSLSAFGATPISIFRDMNRIVILGVLLSASGLAIWAFWHRGRRALWFLAPQQLLLVASALASLSAIIRGQYADLVPRPWEFIFADQQAVIILAVFHTWAVWLFAYDA